jgi:rhamnosyltransferase subunit B
MANIILTTMGTGGDVFPFITIGAALKARKHNVTLLTHSYFSEEAQKAGLNFAALDTPEESTQMMQEGPLLNTPRGLLSFLDRHILPKVLIECELIRERYSAGNTILVTRSGPGFAARIASELLRAPLVALFMAPAHILGWKIFEQLMSSMIGPRLNDLRQQVGLQAVKQWEPWLRYQTSIGLWPDWFCQSSTDWPSYIRLVGFVLSDDPHKGTIDDHHRRALTDGKPTVMLTAGTGFFGGQDFFHITAEACRLAGFRALLVSRHKEIVPPRLQEDCLYFPSVPSLGGLMPYVSAVCHHGGMGTLGQAVAAGIPQLIMAAGGDRPDNGGRLKKLGVAEFIGPKQRTPEVVADALRRLIGSGDVKQRCQYLAARFRESSPLETTCEVIERAALTESNI